MRVPGEAGDGIAKVTIHIPDWKEQKLPAATFALPLDHPDRKIQVAKPWKESQP